MERSWLCLTVRLPLSLSFYLCVWFSNLQGCSLHCTRQIQYNNLLGLDQTFCTVLCSLLYDNSDIDPVCRLDSLQRNAIASSMFTAFIRVLMSGLYTPTSQPTKPLGEVYLWLGKKKTCTLCLTHADAHTRNCYVCASVCVYVWLNTCVSYKKASHMYLWCSAFETLTTYYWECMHHVFRG